MKTILTAALLILIFQPIWACEADDCPVMYECSSTVRSPKSYIPNYKGNSTNRDLKTAIVESFKNAKDVNGIKGSGSWVCQISDTIPGLPEDSFYWETTRLDEDEDGHLEEKIWAYCSYSCSETSL